VGAGSVDEGDDADTDIDKMMAKELEDIRNTGRGRGNAMGDSHHEKKLFISVKLDAQCVVYFCTNPPIQPSSFVHAICTDFAASGVKQCRWTNRLTPIELTGKATVEGIEEVAMHVLKPWFHEGQTGVAFAIRPSLRNHDVLTRDIIIETVARCVGRGHRVDLRNYDVLILVEVYKNMCGMSVVKDWDKLKRFNLVQIQESEVQGKSKSKTKAQKSTAHSTEKAIQDVLMPEGSCLQERIMTQGQKHQDPEEITIFSAMPHIV